MSDGEGRSQGSPGRRNNRGRRRRRYAEDGGVGAIAITLPKGTIHIDGSVLEGGGQILRNASALSAIMGQPIRVIHIRAGRATAGLRPQHAAGLQLVRTLCAGELGGCRVGSTAISLVPSALRAGHHVGDTRTAGSITLLAQAALPCLLLAGSCPAQPDAAPASPDLGSGDAQPEMPAPAPLGKRTSCLELRGGTDTSMAPPVDYMQYVLLPTLCRHLGVSVQASCHKRGFYPWGGGHVTLTVEALPAEQALPALTLLEQGRVVKVAVRSFVAGRIPKHVALRLATAAKDKLQQALGADVTVLTTIVEETQETAVGDGGGLSLVAETSTGLYLGAAALVERGTSAETLAKTAVDGLLATLASGACVDQWMQDQLIVFMALAAGRSRVRCGSPSLHARTAMVVAERLTPARFMVNRLHGQREEWVIECVGAGVVAPT